MDKEEFFGLMKEYDAERRKAKAARSLGGFVVTVLFVLAVIMLVRAGCEVSRMVGALERIADSTEAVEMKVLSGR